MTVSCIFDCYEGKRDLRSVHATKEGAEAEVDALYAGPYAWYKDPDPGPWLDIGKLEVEPKKVMP